jgi:hypothetical protein
MKTLTLLSLLTFCAATTSEALAANPVAIETTSFRADGSHPRGLLGLFKGKKHKPHKPAYRRGR